MTKKRTKSKLLHSLPSLMYLKRMGIETFPEVSLGKKTKEYELLYLDDLEKMIFLAIRGINCYY